ncbi:acyl-CoA-binding protein (ACBP)/diazepam binding inhibitor (DBI)/endozepine (EP) [Blastocladiella emersonii ATCC 22665]|nr:acyl-CoA-binding protein (ACBP)/diazepam binding inhibitor (DBI)/endozepine (EP) [Blastocladiella emersonii ATCC 22665]
MAEATGNTAFIKAAEEAKALSYKPSNDELLELYSLFKQGTVGDVQGDRPGFFDMQGRAKYDAWASKKGISKEDAQSKYVEYVETLKQK